MQANTATMQMTHLSNSMKQIARVFRWLLGCRHSHMSRPYTVNDERYYTCLECGARRLLDRYTWAKLHPYCF
jgi:hypothetical protein